MLLQVSAQSVGLFLHAALVTPTPTATQTPSTQFWIPTGGGWEDPTIVAAIITSVVSVVAIVYSIWHNRKVEQERDEQQKLHDQEKAEQQRRHDQEMERFRRELDVQYREREQEEQREEAARHEMLMAQNNDARAKVYRERLCTDPRISRIQIFEMRPLEVTSVYVRVRVHEDVQLRYQLDPLLSEAEQQRDPNLFLKVKYQYLEQRATTAIEPHVAIQKHKKCIIVGDPGAGKTTLLKYLALAIARATIQVCQIFLFMLN